MVAGPDSLQGGPKRPLNKAVKIKPSLPWLLQDAEDNRLMGHLWRRAARTEGSCPKREAANTACSGTGGVKLAESHGLDETSKAPGAEGNDSGFGACPAGFQFDFGPIFSCCSPFLPPLERVCLFCAAVRWKYATCVSILLGLAVKSLPRVFKGNLDFPSVLELLRL